VAFDAAVGAVSGDFGSTQRISKQVRYGDNVTAVEFPSYGSIFASIFFSMNTVVSLQLTTMFFFTGQGNVVFITIFLFLAANLWEAYGIYKENCKAENLFRNGASHLSVQCLMSAGSGNRAGRPRVFESATPSSAQGSGIKSGIKSEDDFDRQNSYKLQSLTVDHLLPGDVFELKAGQKVPCDCVIIEGSASVNESNLTGEAVPIQKFAAETATTLDYIQRCGKKFVLYGGSTVIESKRGVDAATGTSDRVKELLGGEIPMSTDRVCAPALVVAL
jgi:hypothetical protein